MNREEIENIIEGIIHHTVDGRFTKSKAVNGILNAVDQYKPPHIHASSVHGNVTIHGYQPDPDAMPPGEPPTVEDTISGKDGDQ